VEEVKLARFLAGGPHGHAADHLFACASCSLGDLRGPRTRCLPCVHFGFGVAQPERRYDVMPVTRAGAYPVSSRRCIGGRGVHDGWIRRQGWSATPENGWVCRSHRGSDIMRQRWEHRGSGIAITLSQPTANTDGVTADPHQVGSATGDSQSDADETESRILIEPADRAAETPSRTDTDAIGDEESLAAADPRRDHHDPDSHCGAECVDHHPDGECQPIADCQPIALVDRRGRVCRNKRSFLVLVGAGGFVACSRGSDTPSRAGTASTSLEGRFCNGRARSGVVCTRARS
jgi:hypothetical protein